MGPPKKPYLLIHVCSGHNWVSGFSLGNLQEQELKVRFSFSPLTLRRHLPHLGHTGQSFLREPVVCVSIKTINSMLWSTLLPKAAAVEATH